jgi:tetratricopeptide (TPR) repeat protein
MAKVSVIIPAYNQAPYLSKSIQSVLDQTCQDFEIMVVDDGSTDDTAAVVQSFHDDRIHYIYQENRGLSAARNTGIDNSTAEYITYLDSDDLFLPMKIELLGGVLDQDPDIGFLAGQAVPIDELEKPVGKIFDAPMPGDLNQLLLGNPLHVGSVMLRRSWQEKVGLFDESLRSYEDWDMWLRLARANCRMSWVAKPVSLYRFHRKQMTRQGNQMTQATFAVLDKHFSDPDLPESWRSMCDLAYSNANLRAAMQAYHVLDFSSAHEYLLEASRLQPDLLVNRADLLARRLAAFASSPKNQDPVKFLETIYNHLPVELGQLKRRRTRDLGQAALDAGFEQFQLGDYRAARAALLRALRYQPEKIKNRGVLSVLSKCIFPSFYPPRKMNVS